MVDRPAAKVVTEEKRDGTLKVFAVLFGLLAISNFLKPLALTSDTGLVLFGHRLSGTANAIAGPLFGVFLSVYAYGIWSRRRYALRLAYAYAAYVPVNLLLFNLFGPKPADAGLGYAIFGLVYAVIAIGVSGGAAVALHRRRGLLT
jgi:hypothetical protein